MIVVDGEDVARFIEGKLGIKVSQPYFALGFLTDGKRPLAAVLFNEYTKSNIEMTAVAEPGGLNRGVARYIAQYVFGQLGCRRLTVRTKKRNKRVLQLAPRYGFKYESVAKHYYPDDDAVVFRMLRSECPWL